jgi:dihydroflavonol-4-reductase
MKVLVTGATGFVGSHLCRTLVERGFHVTALRRSTSNIDLLGGLDLDFALGDVTDPYSLEAAARGQEAVIHAAALAGNSWSRLRSTHNQVNIEGTQNVVAACQRAGVRRLLYVSTVAAVGIPEHGQPPADEDFPFNLDKGIFNYAISKKRAEEVVITGCRNGLDAVIVNPSTILGEWGSSYRGSEWVEKICHRRIAFYFTGGCNLVYIGEVVDGIICALERGRSGHRYILAGQNLSYKEAAHIVARRLGQTTLLLPVLPLATRLLSALDPLSGLTGWRLQKKYTDIHFIAPLFQYYTSAKAIEELGYRSQPFSDILEDILHWYDQRPGIIA